MIATFAAGDAILSVNRLRVEFGSFVAVRDISFSLRPGELLGLIGPNGAGKTTLLRAIAGLQPAATGDVRVLDQEMFAVDPVARRQIGFTPDTPPYYDSLSVSDFLRFIAKGYEIPTNEAESRIEFWLEKVWLAEKANQKIKALSRGMRQRIGLARALLPNPALVLLDEPAAGLDPAGRVQFRQLLCDLREQGKALIVSSHILSDMDEYCTHIGIMQRGEMVRYGTVSEVAAHADAGRCRYHIVLSMLPPGFAEMLESLPDVSNLRVERERVSFEYLSDRDAAAKLVRELVDRQAPICSFSPDAPRLEQAYLRAGLEQVD